MLRREDLSMSPFLIVGGVMHGSGRDARLSGAHAVLVQCQTICERFQPLHVKSSLFARRSSHQDFLAYSPGNTLKDRS